MKTLSSLPSGNSCIKREETAAEPLSYFAKACADIDEQKRFKIWSRAKSLWRGDLVFEKASIGLIN